MNNSKGHIVYLALGSNIGERLVHLEEGINALAKTPGIELNKVSSIYETEPVGYADQQHFLNLVIRITTTHSPEELLQLTQEIEKKCGRVRTIVNGPRTLDIDILFVDDKMIEMNQLIIPHPRLWERGFVLIPLSDLIEESTILPGTSFPLSVWLERVKEKAGVAKCSHITWDNEYARFVSLKDIPSRN